MSLRRLNPPILVLTGVENSGKTTLSKALSEALGWPCVLEAARQDETVIQGTTRVVDLERLLGHHMQSVAHLSAQVPPGLVCDTGPLVLDRWCSEMTGHSLQGALEAQKRVDLYLLCQTLTTWEPDPLRSLPLRKDRLEHQERYINHLDAHQLPWAFVPELPLPERLQASIDLIAQHLGTP